jgi:ADP-dependent NAD(P)H-hydrate dehydratase / NAD(P)H-hydrate epimerase
LDFIINPKILDLNAEFRGVPAKILMQNAGKAAAKEILKKWQKPKKIQIFCGSGGNGGDGFVVALEFLKRKINTEIILAVQPKNPTAKFYFAQIPQNCIKKFSPQIKLDGEILIDALLGVGGQGKLKKPFAQIVSKIMQAKKKIVSLDLPTGNLKPNLTIAFHASKNSPQEKVVKIGIPKIAETHFGPGDVKFNFPQRAKNSRKGKNGRVVILGGSREFVGAPIFATLGAIASGVDLIWQLTPEINFSATRKFTPNAITLSLPDYERLTPNSVKWILSFLKKTKATLVLGPGLGRDLLTYNAIKILIAKNKNPLVLDADAILPADELPKFASSKVVLTPHAGELKRLIGKNKPIAVAKKLNAVILQKGRVDRIFSPNGLERRNDTGHSVLTVGGTGDVLAGLVGGLLSRGVESFDAAGIASFLFGRAGEKLALKSESVLPQEVASSIKRIFTRYN